MNYCSTRASKSSLYRVSRGFCFDHCAAFKRASSGRLLCGQSDSLRRVAPQDVVVGDGRAGLLVVAESAVGGIMGGRRAWTVLMISLGSMPWR